MAVVKSQATTISIKPSGASGATTIGEVISFSGFDGQSSEIDTTNLSSVAKEFTLGLNDFGSISLEVNFNINDAGQTLVDTAKRNGTVSQFVLTLPTGAKKVFTFNGYVQGFSISGAVDAVVTASISIRISGAVTIS